MLSRFQPIYRRLLHALLNLGQQVSDPVFHDRLSFARFLCDYGMFIICGGGGGRKGGGGVASV